MSPTITIGITGRVGSGKSYIATMISQVFEVEILDLDKIGHAIGKTPEMIEAVSVTFGPEYVTATEINRPLLGDLVFNNSDARQKLNDLFFPKIYQKTRDLLTESSSPAVLIVGALIHEIGLTPLCTHLVVIDAEDELIISKIGEKFHQISAAQQSRAYYRTLSKWILTNTFSVQDTAVFLAFFNTLLTPTTPLFSITSLLNQAWKAFRKDPLILVPFFLLGLLESQVLPVQFNFSQITPQQLGTLVGLWALQIPIFTLTLALSLDALSPNRSLLQTLLKKVGGIIGKIFVAIILVLVPVVLLIGGVSLAAPATLSTPIMALIASVGVVLLFPVKCMLDCIPVIYLSQPTSIWNSLVLSAKWIKRHFFSWVLLNMTFLSVLFFAIVVSSMLTALLQLPQALAISLAVALSHSTNALLLAAFYRTKLSSPVFHA